MIKFGERHRIIFGCGNFGGLGSSPSLRDKGDNRDRALGLLDQARDLGLTRFDTANTYGGGFSETVLGEWLRARISALDRTQPGLPLKTVGARSLAHDHERHGTTCLFAALNVLQGKVIGRCMPRHRQ